MSEQASPQPLFRYEVTPRWRDLDAFDHVNNSNFLTYLEEARIQWFASLRKPWVTAEFAPLLAAVHINYKRPVPYPSRLFVDLFADKVGTTSVTIGHRITDAASGDLHADGYVVMVWIDRASGKPMALPDSIRAVSATASPPGP